MTGQTIHPAIGYIKDTGTAKGRGVFAARQIFMGEIVEICPVVLYHSLWNEIPKEFQRIVFDWGYLTKGEPASCVALGWGSMYNHSNPANLRYIAVPESSCMHFVAARNIAADEELTVNYNKTGGDISSDDNLWFKDRGITPIE